MDNQAIFEFLRDNLAVNVNHTDGGSYGYGSPSVEVTISLRNPTTGQYEVIASGSDSLPM